MLLFLLVFFSALLMVLLCEKTALLIGLMDQPGERKIHAMVTPRNGGLALFLAVIFSIFYFKIEAFKVIVPSMSLVFLGGVVDDFRKETPAFVKLFFQAVASAVFLYQMDLPWWMQAFLFIFQIGIVNSFNLMDNMNGVTAFLSLSIVGFISVVAPDVSFEFFLCFAAASLAFLARNYPRGKIFLGDQGSQFLGFLISSIFIIEFINDKTLGALRSHGVVVSILYATGMIFGVFSVFLADTFWVIIVRLRNGKSVFQGDQNHLTHNLYRKGVSKVFVPWVLTAVQWPTLALSMFVWWQFLYPLT